MKIPSNESLWTVVLVAGLLGSAACGMSVKRDLRKTPPQQVVYDDMCNLQNYHDTLSAGQAPAPEVVETQELMHDKKRDAQGGRTRFSFASPFQLETLRRVLAQNWDDIPRDVERADRLELEVRWAQKAGVRRVVTEEPATVYVGRDDYGLPYHICLSELLFGQPLYRTRRELLGMTPLAAQPATEAKPAPAPEAPAPEAPAPEAAAETRAAEAE